MRYSSKNRQNVMFRREQGLTMNASGWVNTWTRAALAAVAVLASLSMGGGFFAGLVLVPLMWVLVQG